MRRSPSYWRRILALQESGLFHSNFRIKMLRSAGIAVGTDSLIMSGVHFATNLCVIGSGVLINHGCFFDGSEWVHIERNAFLGPGIKLITGTHEIGSSHQRAGTLIKRPVTIGEGCWLGAACVVLPGVTVSAGCIIGAGAVVTHTTEPDGLYVGIPAKRVRSLD